MGLFGFGKRGKVVPKYRGIRTIILAVDEETGDVVGDLNLRERFSGEARTAAINYAAQVLPNKNYWYKAIIPLYKGSRISVVLCSPRQKEN